MEEARELRVRGGGVEGNGRGGGGWSHSQNEVWECE